MRFAIADDGTKISPTHSGQRALCPGCRGEVVARCGRINIWHWGHLSGMDCDPWAEPLSIWHLQWQKYLASLGADVEVQIEKSGKIHRADARMKNGTVIELQHSNISVDKIEEREIFYGNMIWVFDAIDAFEKERFDLRIKEGHQTFRWKHARKSVAYARKPVRLDLGSGWVMDLKKMSKESPVGGWGRIKFVSGVSIEDA
jgi:competence CoiA-like predicted nuclease